MKRLLVAACILILGAPVAARPGLWVVRDADTEIALFGTVHALPKGVDWLSPAITERLGTAGSVVIEAVPPQDPLALATTVAEIGMSPGQKPMARRLPPAEAAKLRPVAADAGLPMAALDSMETWFAALALSQASLAKLGITAESGVEPVILMRARAARQPVVGLETMEQQLRYLDSLPEADQLAMLISAIADVPEARAETDRLMAMWQAGDIDGLAAAFAEDAKGSPRLQKVLITDRNARWANWIEGVMRSPGKVFLAVGAGHFGGEDGLIALLKAKGLTVERVE